MTNPIGAIRVPPSGAFLSGSVGDTMVCLGGNRWQAQPGGGSGASPAPSNPGDNGAVATASAGLLSYLKGTIVGQGLLWSGTAWAAALIANVNIAGNAAIDVSKLAQNGATSGQAIVWNGSTWAPASVSSPVNLPASPGDNNKVALASAGNLSYAALNPTVLASFSASPAVSQFLKGNGSGVAASWATLTASPVSPTDNNKLAIALNGDFTYALLSDVNVSTTAAIATSKIAPSGTNGQALITTAGVPGWGTDFGAQNLVTTGAVNTGTLAVSTTATIATSLAIGATPATAGILMLPNATVVQFRNAANTANLQALQVGNTNVLTLGLTTGIAGLTVACAAGGTIAANVGGTVYMSLSAGGGIAWGLSAMAFPTGASATISISGNSAADGSQLAVTGGNTTFASATGGLLVLGGGASTNATPGLPGGVKIRTDNVEALGTMIEVTRAATARHYVALFGQNTTTAQMGANTGDYVLCVRDALTIPSADATTGFIHYSDGAKPGWRFNGTNLRLNGTSATANVGGVVPPATVAGYLDVQVNGTQQKIPYYAA